MMIPNHSDWKRSELMDHAIRSSEHSMVTGTSPEGERLAYRNIFQHINTLTSAEEDALARFDWDEAHRG